MHWSSWKVSTQQLNDLHVRTNPYKFSCQLLLFINYILRQNVQHSKHRNYKSYSAKENGANFSTERWPRQLRLARSSCFMCICMLNWHKSRDRHRQKEEGACILSSTCCGRSTVGRTRWSTAPFGAISYSSPGIPGGQRLPVVGRIRWQFQYSATY